jgi:hypothetical protein
MPWLETAPVDERIRFIQDALSDRFTMSELCARYGGVGGSATSGLRGTRRVAADCAIAVGHRTTARIGSTRSSPSSFVRCGASTRSGARAVSSRSMVVQSFSA